MIKSRYDPMDIVMCALSDFLLFVCAETAINNPAKEQFDPKSTCKRHI